MKGKMKILSLLLAIAMVSSMFVACKGEEQEVEPQSTDANSSQPEVKKEPVKLSWYCFGEAPKKPDAVIKALNEQSLKDIQTEIDFKFSPDGDKVKTMVATGGDFDMVFTCAWYNNYIVAAQTNTLADITEKVKTVTPDLYKYIPEVVWEGAKVNGKVYAVPVYKDSAATQFWTANKEYVIDGAKAEAEFKATGADLNTLTPLLKKVKEYNDAGTKYPHDLTAPYNMDQAGLNGAETGWDDVGLGLFVGVKLDSGNTKVIPMFEEADYISRLTTIKSWYDAGYINKDVLTRDKAFEFQVVGTGQGFEGAEAIWGAGKDYTVVINKKFGPIYTTGGIQGSMNGISPNSKNIDRSLEYMQYANTNKVYRNMLAYGIQDVNWKLNDKGQSERINEDWTPSAFSQASFFELYPTAPANPDMWTNLKAANDSAESSPLVGFVANTEKIKNDIAACSALLNKYVRPLKTGDVKDVKATCAAGMKALRAAGLDKIIAELQTQVDAFIAAK